METEKGAPESKGQTKLEFSLSWLVGIAVSVIGSQLGGVVGIFVFFPIGAATGLAAAAALAKPWTLRMKIGAMLLIYGIVGFIFWLMFWIIFPIIRMTLGFAP